MKTSTYAEEIISCASCHDNDLICIKCRCEFPFEGSIYCQQDGHYCVNCYQVHYLGQKNVDVAGDESK